MSTLVCFVACGVLVWAESRELHQVRGIAKLVASGAFIAVATPAANGSVFARWMFVGLVLGAIGDMFLLGRRTRDFVLGLAAFLAGHVVYVVGLAQLEPPGRWLGDAGILAILPLAGGALVLRALWDRLGILRVPVVAYVAAIVAMVIAAFAVYRAGALPPPQCTYLALGAALFFVSDLAVARDRFLGRAFANKLWGLPAYYAAQLLIAWAIR